MSERTERTLGNIRFSRLQVDVRETLAIIIAVTSLLIAGMTAYSSNDKQIEHRLTAVETSHAADQAKIDHIQSQVDKLVEWALGHK